MSEPLYYTLIGLGVLFWLMTGIALVLDQSENPPSIFRRMVPRWVGLIQACLWPVIIGLELAVILIAVTIALVLRLLPDGTRSASHD